MDNAQNSRYASDFLMIFVLSLDSKRYVLNSGDGMPAIGIGTRKAQDPGVFREAVKDALVKGYRHTDT